MFSGQSFIYKAVAQIHHLFIKVMGRIVNYIVVIGLGPLSNFYRYFLFQTISSLNVFSKYLLLLMIQLLKAKKLLLYPSLLIGQI